MKKLFFFFYLPFLNLFFCNNPFADTKNKLLNIYQIFQNAGMQEYDDLQKIASLSEYISDANKKKNLLI